MVWSFMTLFSFLKEVLFILLNRCICRSFKHSEFAYLNDQISISFGGKFQFEKFSQSRKMLELSILTRE